jgi:hypothetical protein
MPDTITPIADAMQTVLDQIPEQHARSSGFLRRQRKLTAAVFVKALVFGWLANPKASLDELARVAALLGIAIQPQSLEERFTPEAAELLRRVLEASLLAVITADPVAIAILNRFTEVVLLDSSTVSLPEPLRALFAGCGTSNPQAGNAAVKLTVARDLGSVATAWAVLPTDRSGAGSQRNDGEEFVCGIAARELNRASGTMRTRGFGPSGSRPRCGRVTSGRPHQRVIGRA